MERLAERARIFGCQNENLESSGTTIWGGEGEAIALIPCFLNTAMARGICRAEVTRSICSIWRSFNLRVVYKAFSCVVKLRFRSEEHTSELQSLMRISSAVFCLKKKQHYSES